MIRNKLALASLTLMFAQVCSAQGVFSYIPSEDMLIRAGITDYLKIEYNVGVRNATGQCEEAENSLIYKIPVDRFDSSKGFIIKSSALKDKYIVPVSLLNQIELCEEGFCLDTSIRKPRYESEVDPTGASRPIIYLHHKSLLVTQGSSGIFGKFCMQFNPQITSSFVLENRIIAEAVQKDGKAILTTKYYLVDKADRSFSIIAENQVDVSQVSRFKRSRATPIFNSGNYLIGTSTVQQAK